MDGLNLTGLLPKMMLRPDSFMEVFCKQSKKLTGPDILDMFEPRNLDENGSNKRQRQNRAISFWRDFVLDVEGNAMTHFSEHNRKLICQ